MTLAPRVVLVHRRTELDDALARHGTHGQASFFLTSRGRDIGELETRHALNDAALKAVSAAIPPDWRRGRVERADLSRFLFEPEDVVVVVGQDGLVANTAKYLDGQPVLGINPDPERNPGVLVPHSPSRPPRSSAVRSTRAATSSCGRWSRPTPTTASACWPSTRSSSGMPATRPPATPSRWPTGAPKRRRPRD